MSNCINKNTKEFKDLVKKLNSTDIIGLSADIQIWQDTNGLDKFPTKNDLLFNKKVDGPTAYYNSQEGTDVGGKKIISSYYEDGAVAGRAIAIKELGAENVGELSVPKTTTKRVWRYEIKKPVPSDKVKENYFKESNTSDSLSILDKIANSSHALAPLAKRFKNYAKYNNCKVILDNVDGYPSDNSNQLTGMAYYDPNKNEIHIARNYNFNKNQIEVALMHEMFHSISRAKLRDGSTVSKDFEKLYAYAITQLSSDPTINYGLLDKDEFFVALFTDAKLIKKLQNTKASNGTKYSNLFEEIMNYLLGLLNIGRTSSLYEEAFAMASHIVTDYGDSQQSYENTKDEPLSFSKAGSKEKTYADFKIINGMPFQNSTIEKMKAGDQRITIRTKDHPDGIYEINGEKFHILNLGRRNVGSFKNVDHLKKKFKGDDYEEGKFKHIDEFFKGNQNLFVYQITKINNSIINSAVKITPELISNPNYTEPSSSSSSPNQNRKSPTFERQYVFFKRKLNKLKKELDRIDKNSDEFKIKKAELEAEIKRFNEATEDDDKKEYVEMAKEYLKWVQDLIERLPASPDKYVLEELVDAFDILEAFDKFDSSIAGIVMDLEARLFPYIVKNNINKINSVNNGIPITALMIDEQNKDIGILSKGFGSLSDVSNYIGRTIGSIINAAKNKASAKNKQLEAVIQKEVDALSKYAKDNGMTLDQVYDILIQEKDGTLVLTQSTVGGKINPNYNKIQSTPELKKFYDFYQKVLMTSQMNLPYKVGKFYILNKKKTDLKTDIKNALDVSKEVVQNDFVSSDDLVADIIPDMFRSNINASEKSRNLGAGLLEFAAYSNNHAAMSEILPEVRLLQMQLKYEQKADGTLVERQFIKSSNSQNKISAGNSNIYNMIKIVIDMQVKGKMKDSKSTPYKYKMVKDADGNVISYKQIQIEDVVDKMLRWNSLLRIGLSPITSITNVLFGDISNFIEAIGGQHFTFKSMNNATNIFRKQLDYVGNKSEGSMYKWLDLLNPLQELSDYELGDEMRLDKKKLSVERATEIMYSMQKKGEFYLQARTMLALLISEGYMNADGTNTKKGDSIAEDEAAKLSDKVQRLNQMIHGRYTQREAATFSQSIIFRAAIQFRKWIPSAVENRFGENKFDNRLGVQVEGRYVTIKNKVFKADSISQAFENLFLPLLNSQAALNRGNMTKMEIYNMRKNMVELILLTATVLLAAGLKGDDDEWKKNPIAKSGLTMLNRISGDLLFFYNPQNASNIMKNIAPVNKLIIDLFDVTASLPHAVYLGDYQINRGSLKGSNEFYVNDIPSIVPGFAPWTQIQKMLNTTDILPELN